MIFMNITLKRQFVLTVFGSLECSLKTDMFSFLKKKFNTRDRQKRKKFKIFREQTATFP